MLTFFFFSKKCHKKWLDPSLKWELEKKNIFFFFTFLFFFNPWEFSCGIPFVRPFFMSVDMFFWKKKKEFLLQSRSRGSFSKKKRGVSHTRYHSYRFFQVRLTHKTRSSSKDIQNWIRAKKYIFLKIKKVFARVRPI